MTRPLLLAVVWLVVLLDKVVFLCWQFDEGN